MVIKYIVKWSNLSDTDIVNELSGKGITDNVVIIISQRKNSTLSIILNLLINSFDMTELLWFFRKKVKIV